MFKKKIPDHTLFQSGLVIVFITLVLNLTVIRNDSVLKWIEGLSIFLPTSYYLADCFQFAGGLLIYAGTFFTQFLYHPWLGSIILVVFLLIVQYLSIKVFRISGKYFPLSFIPGLMLLLSVSDLGYVWMSLKSPGYFFSNILGVISFLSCFMVYKKLNHLILRILFLLFILIAGYPLLGFYALFSGGIVIIYELLSFVKDKEVKRFSVIAIGILAIVLVPQVYYYFAYSDMQYFYIYLAALPRFFFNSKEFVLWIPFIVLFLSFILFTIFLFHSKKKQPNNIKMCSFILLLHLSYYRFLRMGCPIKMRIFWRK